MKRLRRKKSSDDIHTQTEAIAAVSIASHSSEPPLYARFATTHKSPNGSSTARPIVSGPMALAAKSSFHGSPGRGNGHERDPRQLKRTASRTEQERVLVSPPPRSTSRVPLPTASHGSVSIPSRIRPSVSLDGGSSPQASKPLSIPTLPKQEAVVEVRRDLAPQRTHPDLEGRASGTDIRYATGEHTSTSPPTLPPMRLSISLDGGSSQQIPLLTHASGHPSVSALPIARQEVPILETQPPAVPIQRAAEHTTHDPITSSSAVAPAWPSYSPTRTTRNASPSATRKRNSRIHDQQRISFDLSPENYSRLLQSHNTRTRSRSPQKRPTFPTPSASSSSGVAPEDAPTSQLRSRRTLSNVAESAVPIPYPKDTAKAAVQPHFSSTPIPSSEPLHTTIPSTLPSSPPRPSLTSSPSVARRKYSPMAAFGFPVSQTQPPMTVTSLSVPNFQDDKAPSQTDDGRRSIRSGFELLPEIPSPQPESPSLPEVPASSADTLLEHSIDPEPSITDEPNGISAGPDNTSDVTHEPRARVASASTKPPVPKRDPLPPNSTTSVPAMTATVIQTVLETRVRVRSSSAKSTPKKELPQSHTPSQANQRGHNASESRTRKPSSASKVLSKRDSPPSNSPAPSSPKSQSRKLGDSVDLVTMPILDTSVPSDSRYPLPSRSSSRSTPSPALNSSRASPTADMPDGGRGSPSAREVTSSVRVKPGGSRPRRSNSASQHPTASSPHSAMEALTQSSGPAYQNVPIRGRPLIFAAMSVASSEMADVEPGTTPEDEEASSYRSPYDDSSPPAPSGYPSPTPSGRRSPHKVDHLYEERLPVQPESDATRRLRKLSKAKKTIQTGHDAATAQPVVGQHPADTPHVPQNQIPPHSQHHYHHTPSSQPAENSTPESPLGPPFQLQPQSQLQPNHHGYSSGEESPRKRTLSNEQGKPRHGVKALTDKQLEKLNRRSIHGTNGVTHREREAHVVAQNTPIPPPPPPKQLLTPPTPPSPEEYARARTQRRGQTLDKSRAPLAVANVVELDTESSYESTTIAAEPELEEFPEPRFYPLAQHISDSVLLGNLLCFLAYFEWCQLSAVSREIRKIVSENQELEELVLERYLRTVGYSRWSWKQPEPLKLNLQDLSNYMRGVSIPSHQYARTANTYLQPDSQLSPVTVQEMAASCRAFTRVVLRLRAQAEAEAEHNARLALTRPQPSPPLPISSNPTPSKWASRGTPSRSSSRAPSPTSSFSHSQSHAHNIASGQLSVSTNTFRSPLFRLRRAPLLQVFVPSPEGDWLSDASVLECETELKRAGVTQCLRAGDVVWDVAVGDEGNVGRLIWDGCYLIDLDYTYSRVGDLPRYLPTLAFPPSYFHRVIRTMGTGNPAVHVDLGPWEDQIASNLQLLQDRMKTETPQGGHHTVVRWVHRSSFTIKPRPGSKTIRIPVPPTAGPGPAPSGAWVIDPGWYGTVIVETEGTNEGLADLQARCQRAFPPRAEGASMSPERAHREERRTIFRILRERSRPGEIWLRTVREKDRLLPYKMNV